MSTLTGLDVWDALREDTTAAPATQWAWTQLSVTHAVALNDDERLTLLAAAMHADLSLHDGNGYSSTTSEHVAVLRSYDSSDRQNVRRIERTLIALVELSLLVRCDDGGYRIPEAAFDS